MVGGNRVALFGKEAGAGDYLFAEEAGAWVS